jgi:hypothetical protein
VGRMPNPPKRRRLSGLLPSMRRPAIRVRLRPARARQVRVRANGRRKVMARTQEGGAEKLQAWWALRSQKRRRQRGGGGPLDSLLSGLVQFYRPVPGQTCTRSWNETVNVSGNPFAGCGLITEEAGGGTYVAGSLVSYGLWPYAEIGGVKHYAGTGWGPPVLMVAGDGSTLVWEPWASMENWVSGFAVLRYVDGVYAGFRFVDATEMLAGWEDGGFGWSDAVVYPADFNHPPMVVKALWNIAAEGGAPTLMPTVMGLFGPAFASNGTDVLCRVLSVDIGGHALGTLAYWVCPAAETVGVLDSLRTAEAGKFGGNYTCAGGTFRVGDSSAAEAIGHQDGDWYLVVMRNEPLLQEQRIELFRERDGQHFWASQSFGVTGARDLEVGDDYLANGLGQVLVIGGSYYYWVMGSGYFDRIGVWERYLADDELANLFNNGLGWAPS